MPQETDATGLDGESADFYREALQLMNDHQVPFLLGGAYALSVYTGLVRHTKDIDFFIRASDLERALVAFDQSGFASEKTFPHWLAKVFRGADFVDLIYAAGNGLCQVDDSWFGRAQGNEFLGVPVKVMAPEEIIWMKAFIQERERFDGADIAHLIHGCAESIDWAHLASRFGPDWRVLFSTLILFGYIYPSERHRLPANLLKQLGERLEKEQSTHSSERVCRGTLLSRAQYLPDVTERGYGDARLERRTAMSEDDIEHWTAAIEDKNLPRVSDPSA
jgi:hypothetical protein